MNEPCSHEQFTSEVGIYRLSDVEGGPVTRYSAEIRIACAQCGSPFSFIGVERGLSPNNPMCNTDATELRAPIAPGAKPTPTLTIVDEIPPNLRDLAARIAPDAGL